MVIFLINSGKMVQFSGKTWGKLGNFVEKILWQPCNDILFIRDVRMTDILVIRVPKVNIT